MAEGRPPSRRDPVRQAAALPYRRGGAGLELALISTRDGRRWVVPKGRLEPDLGPAGTAALEAFEEAGLEGFVDPEPLGAFEFDKAGRRLRVEVFPMLVTAAHADWPERPLRERRWVALEEAAALVAYDGLASCIAALCERLRTRAA